VPSEKNVRVYFSGLRTEVISSGELDCWKPVHCHSMLAMSSSEPESEGCGELPVDSPALPDCWEVDSSSCSELPPKAPEL